jgi:caspase domain-containing protein
MRRHALLAVFAVMIVSIFTAPALADTRIALVIGNGAYQNAPRLPNPPNDAADVAAALKRSGFETILAGDLDKAGMDEATIRFARVARTADVAMFYYSGHALQFGGVNYLAPVDAKLTDEADLRRMVRVDDIVADMQQVKNLRILVLDSCRDNPLANELKRSIGTTRALSLQHGLAKIDSPEGMIVAYATQAGRTAEDGGGRNSPYTAAFLKNIEAKEEIGTIFRRISSDVYEATGQAQLPELSLSLIGEFYLNGKLQVTVGPARLSAPADPCAAAESHWKSAEAIGTVKAFEDHLARFPNCTFAGLAKARIESLKSKVAVAAPAGAANLTGTWSANDGGTYTIKQLGTQVSWEGVSADGGKRWSHTFNGEIRDNLIVGRFFDHPPGLVRNAGDLKIKIVDANRLEMVVAGTRFGGSVWIRSTSPRP